MRLCHRHIRFQYNISMNPQFSQDYNVDERYEGLRGHRHTVDNTEGLRFLRGYVNNLRATDWPRPFKG